MQESGPTSELDGISTPEAVLAAIEGAETQDPPSYFLAVSCVDEKGARSLRVLPSGTSIWNRTTQIVAPPSARREFLAMLKRADYPTMKKSYGGKKKKGMGAALRIRCEVSVDFGGLQKTSVQLADGEQSPRVEGLAREILDYTESLGLEGVTAPSLSEAMNMWMSGRLRPDTLNIRILQLPRDKGQDGMIVEVRRGEISRSRYAPGRGVGSAQTEALDHSKLQGVVQAFLTADFEKMPANLMADQTFEVEVVMLDYRKKVIGRSFGRPLPDEMSEAQARFNHLRGALQTFVGAAEEGE